MNKEEKQRLKRHRTLFERVGEEEYFGQEKKAFDTGGRFSRRTNSYTFWISYKTVYTIMDRMKKVDR